MLNKYYPPDFDPAKLPKLPIPKDRQYVVRLMAPFTMRCITCGNYVYKGKKFNSRKETAIGEKYLGIQIFRFYIRCPTCLSEICFKTDPENTDYSVVTGAYRTFQAGKLAEMEAERVVQEKEEEEANNPMLALENRTKESRREMDVIDALEEIRDYNARNAQVKFEDLMERHIEHEVKERDMQEQRDEALVNKMLNKRKETVKRLDDDDDDDDDEEDEESSMLPSVAKKSKLDDSLTDDVSTKQSSQRSKLAGMIVKKKLKTAEKVTVERDSGPPVADPSSTAPANTAPSSLSLLGAYSDNETSEDEER